MAKAAWGKPVIKIGAVDATGKTIPTTGLQTLASVKENSTKFESAEGEKKELKGEGGVTLDVRRSAPSYTLELEVFILKGEALPRLLKGDAASIVITPEDPETAGLYIPMANISVSPAWSTEEGAAYKVKADAVLAKDTSDVKAFYFTKSGAILDPFTGTN